MPHAVDNNYSRSSSARRVVLTCIVFPSCVLGTIILIVAGMISYVHISSNPGLCPSRRFYC